VVLRTALCDQRRKLDESCSSMVCRASPLVSPSRNTKKKIQSVQRGKNVRKTMKTGVKKGATSVMAARLVWILFSTLPMRLDCESPPAVAPVLARE